MINKNSGLVIILVFIVYFINSYFIFAQSPNIYWTKTHGGTANDLGHSVKQTNDGGYIILGDTWSYGSGDCDLYLVKTDSLGNLAWTKYYGGSARDYGWSVVQTTDGGYVLAGYEKSTSGGTDYNVYLVKTDSYGNQLWTKTFGGSNFDYGRSVYETADEGLIIVGQTQSFGVDGWDVYLIRTDAFGNLVWSKTFGGNSDDEGWSVEETTDNGFIIAGRTESFGAGGQDVYLIKTDSYGDTIWTKTYGGSGTDRALSVKQTTDQGYIVAGNTYSFGNNCDIYLLKLYPTGDLLWTKTIGGANIDEGWSIDQTIDHGFIIGGRTNSSGTSGGYDYYLVKTDAFGYIDWTKTFGGTSNDYGISVQKTENDGYIFTGYSQSVGSGGYDFYTICLSPDPAVGLDDPYLSKPQRYELNQNYPNPFNQTTNVSFSIPKKTNISLEIYSISGEQIATIIDNVLYSEGSHKILINMDNLSSGLYLYKLKSNFGILFRKMILLK